MYDPEYLFLDLFESIHSVVKSPREDSRHCGKDSAAVV